MKQRVSIVALLMLLIAVSACQRQAIPAELDTVNTACQYCRMAVSDVHFAAQISAPGVEPQFFDDLGCLRDYLKQNTTRLPARAMVFVADHRTGEWVRASEAVFTRVEKSATPMTGGIVAHANEASRKLDTARFTGVVVPAAEIFGPAGPPNGGRP